MCVEQLYFASSNKYVHLVCSLFLTTCLSLSLDNSTYFPDHRPPCMEGECFLSCFFDTKSCFFSYKSWFKKKHFKLLYLHDMLLLLVQKVL